MSGAKRNILAELARKGVTGEASQAALSPEKIREEKGRSTNNGGIVKNEDGGQYLGKNGRDTAPSR